MLLGRTPLILLLLLTLLSPPGLAKGVRRRSEVSTPWGKGTTKAQRREARRLLSQGNELFLQKRFREALERYESGISAWDHPAIRFNMVRAYINLDRPLEAYENLEHALRYGAAPLKAEVYEEALNYRRLLEAQIGLLGVECKQDGVSVSVDGKPFLECPGKRSIRTRPGQHQLVGQKPQHLTHTEDVLLLPGQEKEVFVRLSDIEGAMVETRRWAAWKPWAVAGAGALVAGIGALLRSSAVSSMDTFATDVARLCPRGCVEDPALATETVPLLPESIAGQRDAAQRTNTIAVSAIAVGSTALLTGLVGVFLNTPRLELPEHLKAQSEPVYAAP